MAAENVPARLDIEDNLNANTESVVNEVHPSTKGTAFVNESHAETHDTAKTNDNNTVEILELATSVARNIAIVNDYLQANNLPFPSFHEDGPIDLKLNPEAEKARITALEASMHLHDLLLGPTELLRPTVSIFGHPTDPSHH